MGLSLPAKSSTNSKFQSAVQWGCNDLRRNDDAPWPDHIAPAWTHKLVSKSTSSTNSRARGVGHDIGRRSEPESRDCRGIAAHLATHLGLAAQLELVFAAHMLVRSPSSCRLSETLHATSQIREGPAPRWKARKYCGCRIPALRCSNSIPAETMVSKSEGCEGAAIT